VGSGLEIVSLLSGSSGKSAEKLNRSSETEDLPIRVQFVKTKNANFVLFCGFL
jgi:hypothetical protein